MRYAAFIISLNMLKGTVDMKKKKNSLEEGAMRVLLLEFQLEIWDEHTTSY